MTKHDDTNKAGDTKTTSKEYVKRESGEQDMPKVPAENPGNTSTSEDDLDHPDQLEPEHSPAEDKADDKLGKKIKDANEDAGE